MDPIEIQFNKAKDSIVFPAERQKALRQNLAAYAALNPAARASGVLAWRLTFFSRSFTYVAAAIILVVAGTGTALAANRALPGDQLYVVKTTINEPVRAALTFNADARADYESTLATRRMEEATVLAVEGKLDAETQVKLGRNFESHAQAVQKHVERLRSNNDNDKASSLAAGFASKVTEREQKFSRDRNGDIGNDKNNNQFLSKVSETLNSVAKASPSAAAVVDINDADDTIVSTKARLNSGNQDNSQGGKTNAESARFVKAGSRQIQRPGL